MELYKFLPKTNCKKCGLPTCMAFSLDLLKGKVKVDDCTPLLEPKYKEQYDALKELLGSEEGQEKELRINIDEDLCDGCGICVPVCEYNALEVVPCKDRGEDEKIVQLNEAMCKGCGACVAACPSGAMEQKGFKSEQMLAMIRAALAD